MTARPVLKALVLAGILLLFGAPRSEAHKYLPEPEEEGAPTPIDDIAVSYAAYREISPAGDVDWFEFTARRGDPIYVQMTIPLLPRLRGFAPSFALAAPGGSFRPEDITLLEDGVSAVDDPAVRARLGLEEGRPLLAVSAAGGDPEVFREPFTGTRYWIRQTVTVSAPLEGTYRLAVYAPPGETGKYVLATGREERFGLKDILTLPAVRIRVRRFMEQGIAGDVAVLTLVGLLAAGGIFLGIRALAD